jgi:ribulose kinase
VSSEVVLGIDVGTEAARVAVFDLQGALISASQSPYNTTFVRPGWAEQDPRQVWNAVAAAMRACAAGATPQSPIACSIASTAVSAIAVDASGEPMGSSLMWMDTRATPEAMEISATRDPSLWHTGGSVSPEWMLPKALWVKRHDPDLWRAARWFVDVQDWLIYKLTDRWVGSSATASAEWGYDGVGGWPTGLLEAVGLTDVVSRWPETFLGPGEVVGVLTEEASIATGLAPGLPVVQGLMDSFAAAIAGNVFRAGRVALSLGSSSAYIGLSEKPVSDGRLLGPIRHGLGPGTTVIQGGQTSAGSLVRWFCSEVGCGLSAAELDRDAALIAPGCDGLLAIDTWQGSRTPDRDPRRRGAFVGLSLAHRQAHLYRAVLESVAFGGLQVLAALREVGVSCAEVIVAGGGSRSPLWLQIHADVLGLPLSPAAERQQVALGAAICAAVGAGVFQDLPEAASAMSRAGAATLPNRANHDLYLSQFQLYRRVSQALAEAAYPGPNPGP